MMEIRILGAHNIETKNTGCICLLVDNILAIDAGALTSKLSITEQQNLKALLITHQHYDHVRDIPALAMNFSLLGKAIDVYGTRTVYKELLAHIFNDSLYPNFMEKPPERPPIRFNMIEPGRTVKIAGYDVLPISVNHAVPTIGYQITSNEGKKIFINSDTGPGLEDCWKQISPEILFTETTMLNQNEGFAQESGHLTPALLQKELTSFREIKGYLPKVILMHMNPLVEKDLKAEISKVEKTLNIKIEFGYEGMKIKI
jgi:ribonuclease BN (tRNA processing enzyme)